MNINAFLRLLGSYRTQISKQTLKTLRGQALSGDIEGAMRGLTHILQKAA